MRRFVLALPLAIGLLAPLSLDAEEPPKPQKVTIDADREPLLGILKKLCASQGFNYVIDSAATDRAGSVCVHLADVSFEDALGSLCEVFGLDARVSGTIVVVRVRSSAAAKAEKPAGNRFLPERETPQEPAPRDPAPAPRDATPPAPAEGTAEVTSHARTGPTPLVTSGGNAMAVGLVVDLTEQSLKLKESSGDPREFVVAGDDPRRTSLLLQALKRLKKGDKVALEYRVETSGQARILNLLGGGRP